MDLRKKLVDLYFSGQADDDDLEALVDCLESEKESVTYYFFKKLLGKTQSNQLNVVLNGGKPEFSESARYGYSLGVQAVLNGLDGPEKELGFILAEQKLKEEAEKKQATESKTADEFERLIGLEEGGYEDEPEKPNEPNESEELA